MATPVWQPGTLYAPGSLVQPASVPGPTPAAIVNPGFESGNTDWTMDSGWSIGQFGDGTHFQGTWSAQWDLTGNGRIRATAAFDVTPGTSITASCQVQQGASSSGQAGARVEIAWYTSGDVFISRSEGNIVDSGSNQNWKQSSVTGVAPGGAAKARIGAYAFRDSGGDELWVDNFVWNLQIPGAPTGLVFRATQANAGYSDQTEPAWPTVVGGTVVDNEVTWEGVFASRVVWEASPILVSDAVEPTFPALADATVADNTILWTAMRANVSQAPNSRVAAIAVSKIFAGDDDIISFSATVNPLDWATAQDAGYIPFGLNTYGGTPVTALGLYRSNLVGFNSQGFQMWQVDQDPANMAILDAVPIPCEYPDTVQPVSNDLVMLTARGVRSMGIAGASTNLQAGFFGQAIDPLVLAEIKAGAYSPFALFYPGAGQYWLVFGPQVFVLTMKGKSTDASWSRYLFPHPITDWAIVGTDLYLRATGTPGGDAVWRVNDEALVDDEGGTDVEFEGYMAWPYLDFGTIGADKMLEFLELVVNGEVDISIGWDQRKGQEALATTPYTTDGDTVNGTPIPIGVTAPSMQVRLTLRQNTPTEGTAEITAAQIDVGIIGYSAAGSFGELLNSGFSEPTLVALYTNGGTNRLHISMEGAAGPPAADLYTTFAAVGPVGETISGNFADATTETAGNTRTWIYDFGEGGFFMEVGTGYSFSVDGAEPVDILPWEWFATKVEVL